MGVAGSVIRIEGGLPENSDSISNIWTLRMNWGLCSGAERGFPNIDILKTSSAEEENILGNIALSLHRNQDLGRHLDIGQSPFKGEIGGKSESSFVRMRLNRLEPVAPGCLLWGGNHFGVGVFSPWVYPLIDP